MSRKVALLIGVSDYGEGIPSLSAPLNDVTAMKRVLENSHIGGFDAVETLTNPDLPVMQTAVQQMFANLHKDDLVLLFFSGHGITDDNNRLYLATKGTSKDFYKATSVPASFIQDISLESYAKRQAIILDCCYSGAFAEGWQTKSVGLELEKELGAEGRVVLTSSTATQTSFQQEGEELSLYTQYLVEGMETGAADQDEDGKIHAYELHEYAKAKVQEVKPKQQPGIILDKEGFNILLSQAPVNDPELDFRKLAEKYATEGQITVAGNYILQVKRQELDITDERSDEIINEVLAPYRKRIENIALYQQAFEEAVEQNYPLTERLLNELKDLEDILGLEDKDIAQVKERILAKKEVEYQLQQGIQKQEERKEYEHKLRRYEQELTKAIQAGYPLDKYVRDGLKSYQKTLELTDEDIARLERPLLAQEETKYREKLKVEETNRHRQAEKVRQLELRKQREEEVKAKRKQQEHLAKSESDDLSSDAGVDYTKLRDLLKGHRWEEADKETLIVMLRSMNLKTRDIFLDLFYPLSQSTLSFRLITERLPRSGPFSFLFLLSKASWSSNDTLEKRHIRKIPCTDLCTIDQLWIKYSEGRFGFSVQKRIFENAKQDVGVFATRVGWRGKSGLFKGFFSWRRKAKFTITAPLGHLPATLKSNWVASVIAPRNLFLFMNIPLVIGLVIGLPLVAIDNSWQQVSSSPDEVFSTISMILFAFVAMNIFNYSLCSIAWSHFSKVVIYMFSHIEACNL